MSDEEKLRRPMRQRGTVKPMGFTLVEAIIVVVVIAVIVGFCAHFIEILIFAMAMSIMVLYLGLGTIEGPFDYGFDDFVYFSAVNFSSLGYGDVIPGGALRLIAAFEALTGLLMITWTASFTYLQMEKLWSDSSYEPVTD